MILKDWLALQTLTQVRVPDAQWGQKNLEFEAEKGLLQGYRRRMSGSLAKKPPAAQEVSAKHFLKGRWGRGDCRVCDQLVYNSPIGWWWSGGVVSLGLTLSVLRLQEAWGCVFLSSSYICQLLGGEGVHICKITHEMCIRYYQCDLHIRYFREELKQRAWGKPVPGSYTNSGCAFLQQRNGGQKASHTSKQAPYPCWRELSVHSEMFLWTWERGPGLIPKSDTAASLQLNLKDNFFFFP